MTLAPIQGKCPVCHQDSANTAFQAGAASRDAEIAELKQRFFVKGFEAGRQAEREECAKVCEDEACGGSAFNSAANYMAKAIRARGDMK